MLFRSSYENQVRSEKKLAVILPVALFVILIILYLQFRQIRTTALVFSGILVAWAGGFQMVWLYAQPWFLDFSVFGADLRDLFNVGPINLSVAVWVGFIALAGVAAETGVIMLIYLDEAFERHRAGLRTVNPALRAGYWPVLPSSYWLSPFAQIGRAHV